MALIDMFLTDTVKVIPFIKFGDGEPVYGSPENRKCRFELNSHLMSVYKNPDGEIDQVLSNAEMFCTGSFIPERSKVQYNGHEYTVIKCHVLNGFDSDHLEVYLE